MQKLFIDLDGTLIDSMPRHYKVFEYSLSKVGISCNTSYNRFSMLKRDGMSTKQIYEKELYSNSYIDEVINIWEHNIESVAFLKGDQFFCDAEPAMAFFSNNYETVLVTARKNKAAVFELIHSSFCERFLSEIFVVDPFNASSEKASYISANSKEGDIIIGDTEVDFESGEVTGLKAFLLNRGFRSEKYWRRRNIHSYGGLTDIVNAIQEDGLHIKKQTI